MAYLLLKQVHVAAVVASLAFFVLRGAWMLADSPRLKSRFVRIAPHAVDTVLLASALSLAVVVRQYPFVDAWLTAKLLGLVAYVALGTIALRRGRTRGVRAAAFAGAIACAAYIVAVAVTHSASLGLAA